MPFGWAGKVRLPAGSSVRGSPREPARRLLPIGTYAMRPAKQSNRHSGGEEGRPPRDGSSHCAGGPAKRREPTHSWNCCAAIRGTRRTRASASDRGGHPHGRVRCGSEMGRLVDRHQGTMFQEDAEKELAVLAASAV